MTLTLLLASQQAADAGLYADLPTAFVSLMRQLDGFLWANETCPVLPEPTCDVQNFHDRWDPEDYARCRTAIHDLIALIDDALEASDDSAQLEAWQAIFGTGLVVPVDIAESEGDRRGKEFIDTKYNLDIRLTESVTIDGEVVASVSNVAYSLDDRKNQVDRHRRIEFTYQTTAPTLGHRVFWKAKNTVAEAAARGCYRGEVTEGTPGTSHGEPTRYRGEHTMEVFIVVGNVCVARAMRQVHTSDPTADHDAQPAEAAVVQTSQCCQYSGAPGRRKSKIGTP